MVSHDRQVGTAGNEGLHRQAHRRGLVLRVVVVRAAVGQVVHPLQRHRNSALPDFLGTGLHHCNRFGDFTGESVTIHPQLKLWSRMAVVLDIHGREVFKFLRIHSLFPRMCLTVANIQYTQRVGQQVGVRHNPHQMRLMLSYELFSQMIS